MEDLTHVPMPGTSQPRLHPDTLPPSNQTLQRAIGFSLPPRGGHQSVCPAARPHGRGPKSPTTPGLPGAVLGPQPWSSAAPWGDTLERSTERPPTAAAPHFAWTTCSTSAGVCPGRHDAGVLADELAGPQESHSHDYWRSQAQSWGLGQTLGTRRKGQADKSQEPPPAGRWGPPAGLAWLPGEELVPDDQGQGEPRDTSGPRGLAGQVLSRARGGELVPESVPRSGRGSQARKTCTALVPRRGRAWRAPHS